MKNLICISCPRGCHLYVDENNNFSVTGNSCPRGAEYGKTEVTNPVRTVTHTVKVKSETHPRSSCKTDKPVSKKIIFDVISEMNKIELIPPVKIGDVILKNVCGTDANVVATMNIQ